MNGTGSETMAYTRPPAAPLAGVVDSYLAYRTSGPPGLHRGLPSGWMTFIVSSGDPIRLVGGPDGAAADTAQRAVIAGLHTRPALIRHDGVQAGVAINLSPAAARALLGVPAGALAGRSIELTDVIGPLGDELWERLQVDRPLADWCGIVDDVLVRLLGRRRHHRPPPEVAEAWRILSSTAGRIRVDQVAAEVGWSRQHLRRRFRAEFGLNPKEAARVLRFGRGADLLRSGRHRGSLATLAAQCGYADQAHLNTEWRELAGCSPVEWMADEQVPFLQDDGDG